MDDRRRQPRPGAKQPMTMNDIARMAGVSLSTVSRALSGSPLVAERTKKRIQELARTAEFSVNEQARNLALGQTRTIEVIFPIDRGTLQRVSDPFFVDMLAALTDALDDLGYALLLSKSVPWDPQRPGSALSGGRADGVIFIGQGRHGKAIQSFAQAHSRVVCWGAIAGGEDYCIVGSDNRMGGVLATRHLIDQGRRRIRFLGDISLPESAARHRGYRDALAAAGVAETDQDVVDMPFDIGRLPSAMADLPAMAKDCDAFFAASDMIALAAMRTLRRSGIRVPEDVAIVGFDDVMAAEHVTPGLTTVRQDIEAGGRLLIERLMAILRGGEAVSEKIPVELVVRGSCGAKK